MTKEQPTILEHQLDNLSKHERVDRLLASIYPDLSRSRIKHLIDHGFLKCDDSVVTSAAFTPNGPAKLELLIPAPVAAKPQPQNIGLNIVFEDDELLIIDKPAGLVVHPAPGHEDGTLVNALLHHCGSEFTGIGGEQRPGIVHRLDKDTSGLIVVAKSQTTHEALSNAFATRNIKRCYHALVWGDVKKSGEWESDIGRDPRNRKRMAVVSKGGKYAKTSYKPLSYFLDHAVTLCEFHLATGRTHQIRVHASHNGHPIIGDPLYLKRIPSLAKKIPSTDIKESLLDFPRQALHAKTLGFTHPKTGEELFFESNIPEDFQGLIDTLGKPT